MTFLKYCSKDSSYEFIIPLAYFKKISKKAISCYPKEIGGVFIGFYSNDFHSAKITKLLFNKKDEGSIFRFSRNGDTLTKLLERAWKQSRGKEYYIGEWHSHPNSSPSPSTIDINNMISIAKTQEEQCKTPILGILGNKLRDHLRDIRLFVYPNGHNAVELYFREEIQNKDSAFFRPTAHFSKN